MNSHADTLARTAPAGSDSSVDRIDAERWPGLDAVPAGPRARVAARIARRIFLSTTTRLGITVSEVEEGALEPVSKPQRAFGFETVAERPPQPPGSPQPPAAEIVLHRPEEFFLRLGSDGLIGFGESYLTGAWDSPDLCRLLTVLASDIRSLVPRPLQRLRAAYVAREPQAQKNTVDQSRGNIAHHYDLSNDLFRLFLDPSLSYSSALFDTELEDHGDHRVAVRPGRRDAGDLELGQVHKIERLLDQAGIGPGTRVLEIGTGWGELAIRAAARGAVVRTVTLSSEQLVLAEQRIAAAGLAERVSVELLDYRLVEGEYDAIVSVEMIEAVGHEYWTTYFRMLDSLLAPGGRIAIQSITMPHERMLATRHTWTWINKYVFPGGFLPSVRAIEEITAERTSLRVVDRLAFGHHYAETLRQWDDAFTSAADDVRRLGFDATFLRMWHFYLVYSRAGFASGYIDVNQLTLARPTDVRHTEGDPNRPIRMTQPEGER